MMQNDNELIELVQAGNHYAFSALVNRYGEYFYRISYRYVNDRQNAEDIVQQAFLKLWEFPYKYDVKMASFKVWFCRVIINLSIDFLRKKKINYNIDEYEITDNEEKIEIRIDKQNQIKQLEYFISLLPLRQKNALNLIVYENMSYEEASLVMKLNIGAVKSLVMRAKENLKKYVGDNNNV